MSSFNMSQLIDSMSDSNKEKVIAFTLLVKDVNKVPFTAFEIVSKTLMGVMSNEDEEAVAMFTNNQDILTSATNFIFYHANRKLSEDDEVNRDLALINLIKLCIKDGLKEPLKALLIDLDVEIDSFIIQHIQMFVS